MQTNYKGIDYSGPGSDVNRNTETGVRYGMISLNSVPGESMEDVYTSGDDLGWKAAQDEAKATLKNALEDLVSPSRLDEAVESCWDAISDDWSDSASMSEESGPWEWSDGKGLHVRTSELGLWVFESPWVTECQFCSPCVPGAGNLDSPCEGGVLTYCLPPDWFSEEFPCPYVARLLNPEKQP